MKLEIQSDATVAYNDSPTEKLSTTQSTQQRQEPQQEHRPFAFQGVTMPFGGGGGDHGPGAGHPPAT